jgi:hypothetical protein
MRTKMKFSILKYDVINDSLKVICVKNFKLAGCFGDIGAFGDMGTERILAKNREIPKVFSAILTNLAVKGPVIKITFFYV